MNGRKLGFLVIVSVMHKWTQELCQLGNCVRGWEWKVLALPGPGANGVRNSTEVQEAPLA